eukprot:c25084_g1_i1 orf=406-1545(-)
MAQHSSRGDGLLPNQHSGHIVLVNSHGSEEKSVIPGIKELVDSGVRYVPEQYIRPLSERPCLLNAVDECQPPVIDFAHLYDNGREKVLEEVRRASEEWGFFQVINHGISESVLETMMICAHKFFHEPAMERMRFYKEPFGSKVAYVTNSSKSSKNAMNWKDTLTFQYNPGLVDGFKEGPTVCRDAALEYSEQIRSLSEKMYAVLSESLELDSNSLYQATGRNSELYLSIHYFPPCPDPTLTLGINEHSDIASFTILLQDDVGGLQVLKDDKWISVKPIPGALAINLGDQLEILTNGKYKSVEHRVVTNREKTRMSIACFFVPSPDATIAPLPNFVNENRPPLYKPTIYSEYVSSYLKTRAVVGKSNLDFAKITANGHER